jgi:hypothetical protein
VAARAGPPLPVAVAWRDSPTLNAANLLAVLIAPRPFDADYVTSLSADAVPDLVAALPTLAEEPRRRAAARLLARGTTPAQVYWRTRNLSRARARQAGAENEVYLRDLAPPGTRR